MKALDRSVETLGLWIVTSSVTFIKSANQSSIKLCLKDDIILRLPERTFNPHPLSCIKVMLSPRRLCCACFHSSSFEIIFGKWIFRIFRKNVLMKFSNFLPIVEVSNNSGNRALHGCAFFLFVNRSITLEVCGSRNEIQKVGDLSRC